MPKQAKIALIVCIVLVAGFIGYSFYKKNNFSASYVKVANRDLTEQERQLLDEKLVQIDKGFQEAEEQYKEERFSLLRDKGITLQKLGRVAESRDVINQAIELDPGNSSGYAALYNVQREANDNEAALASIKKSLELNPDNSERWRDYIDLQVNVLKADQETLNGVYLEAIFKTEGNITIMTQYARFLEERGNFQSAKEYWEEAGRLSPEKKVEFDLEVKRLDDKLKGQG